MYWNVKRSGPLCAKDELTLFFYVTADNKEDWQNGIFHNGKYGIFKFETESKKLSLISSQSCMPKFRKCNCASESIAEQKITVWLNQYLNACPLEAPRAA